MLQCTSNKHGYIMTVSIIDPYLKEILDVVFHHKEEGATAAVYETR